MAKKTKAETIHEKIVQAVNETRNIAIKYNGEDSERFISPYLFGPNKTENGEQHDLIRAWQFGGFSTNSREREDKGVDGWKLFDASKIDSVRFVEKGERVDGKDATPIFGKRNSFKTKDKDILGNPYAIANFTNKKR